MGVCKINGFTVKTIYAGIDTYCVYNGEKEIGVTWSVSDVAKMVGADVETLKEEMWRQR